jgi:hypothetical protein
MNTFKEDSVPYFNQLFLILFWFINIKQSYVAEEWAEWRFYSTVSYNEAVKFGMEKRFENDNALEYFGQ